MYVSCEYIYIIYVHISHRCVSVCIIYTHICIYRYICIVVCYISRYVERVRNTHPTNTCRFLSLSIYICIYNMYIYIYIWEISFSLYICVYIYIYILFIWVYVDWCHLTIKERQATILQTLGWSCTNMFDKCQVLECCDYICKFLDRLHQFELQQAAIGWSTFSLG